MFKARVVYCTHTYKVNFTVHFLLFSSIFYILPKSGNSMCIYFFILKFMNIGCENKIGGQPPPLPRCYMPPLSLWYKATMVTSSLWLQALIIPLQCWGILLEQQCVKGGCHSDHQRPLDGARQGRPTSSATPSNIWYISINTH